MHVMQITRVRLNPRAEDQMTASTHRMATAWLEQWTAQRNYQAVIAPSETEGLIILANELCTNLRPSQHWADAKPEHFQFTVSSQDAPDGRFWMPSSAGSGTWYDVPATPVVLNEEKLEDALPG
jgi:hypothetical protein